jgi:integrase
MSPQRGDGSVFWDRRRGRWVGIFTVGTDLSGKRVRRRVQGTTKTEARDKLRALQRQVADGRPALDGSLRLGPYLERWLSETLAPKVESPNTLSNYRCIVHQHLIPALGSKRLRDLTPDDVDTLIRLKFEAKLSYSTVLRIKMILQRALRHAERYGYVTRNVAQYVDLPRKPQRQGRSLTLEQAAALLEVAKGERLEAVIVTGLMLGLRPGELLGLQWSDIDFHAGTLTVCRSLKRENNKLLLGSTKTLTSNRTIDMPSIVASALRQHRIRQHRERLSAGAAWRDADLVFSTEVGTFIDPSNLRRSFSQMTQRAGIGHWHPHELRHSAASLLSADGVPIEQIADLLGHTSIRMTSMVYRHRVAASVNAAVSPMERMFGTTRRST